MKTRLTELLGIDYPIIQGALQYLSRAELAIAVSNAGGLGMIPAMSFQSAEELRREIKKIKAGTTKPFGINVSMLPDVVINDLTKDFIRVIIEEQVPVVETSGNSPKDLVPIFKEHNVTCLHKVSSMRHARKAEQLGVDAVTIVGFECGGHPGMEDVSGSILFAKASDELTIPVIGGGGICDGKSFYGAMSLGLAGVVVGTRFLASQEVQTSAPFQATLLTAQENQTLLTLRSLNNAMRVYRNPLSEKVLAMEKNGATLKELLPVISGIRSYEAMLAGDIDNAQVVVGQAIGRINAILPAAEIIQEFVTGFQVTHQKMTQIIES